MGHQSFETIRRDAHTLIHDAQTLLHDASELTGESASELRTKGATLLQQALDNLRTMEQTAVSKGRQLANDTNQYVHEKPWYAVGIAAGVGVLLGMLISRR